VTLLLHPYLPGSTATLFEALGQPDTELAAYGSRPGVTKLEKIEPLFPKL
jgi:methionyl-tRNA synthetase